MIRVAIYRRHDGSIERFSVDGHAQYDEPGKDIVCAGVSAVTVGTVNAVEALAGLELKNRMKHGMLQVEVPDGLDPLTGDKVQLLLESMVVMLQSIEQSYGAYIAMQDNQKARR
ncbi:ribosomal-processing cysteine protease Prp [Paenibacillus filicis]|uniref:Ribosomal processing cysteine protease Prp n=1 Tax=Paenibacillus gyeongsangnamensis TaxID=3388067 RepID=A0ABT4Q902_9BACL|nr:ribosomal-processing cysteine protease Prp [Paenibacillus filicis]MCZ8513357.1 ribosomal-processing cysteine protease Prp [Paenibacillus filicis]